MPLSDPTLASLAALLKQRLAVIADHDLRTAEPERHLSELRRVSEAIDALRAQNSHWPPRLRHFVDQASFDKALAFLEAEPAP